jgi:septal ring factor EnvC (AmiA/AmiB activator)
LLAFLTLHPTQAWPDSPSPDNAAKLEAAETAARVHDEAAAAARRRVRADIEQAALLAEQQVAAALRLRRLEDETGRAADDLARLQARAAAANAALRANEVQLTALLPIMQRLASAPAATLLATPESPADAVRGIIILQSVANAIESRSEQVRADAAAVAALLGQVAAERTRLAAAAAAQQQAEDALTAQIDAARLAEAADFDTAVAEAAAAAKANANIRDLNGMVAALQGQPAGAPPPAPFGDFAPVAGTLVENYGDQTVAGPAQGVTYQAAPGARVVAPCAGPILFADQFKSYGLLVILGCGADTDFVLSGMHRLDVSSGQHVARGQPVGEMLGFDPKHPAAEPRLYVEYLQNGAPADPSSWLPAGGSG